VSGAPVRIDYLASHLLHAGTLARWHHGAWGDLLADWSLEEAERELRTHVQCRAIPTTVVALDGETPVGSASLLANDDERIRKYSPWLASLYVVPGRRGEGIGAALVRAIVDEAAALAVPRLYLYTTDGMGVVDFYRALGWSVTERLEFRGVEAVVMSIEPGPA